MTKIMINILSKQKKGAKMQSHYKLKKYHTKIKDP